MIKKFIGAGEIFLLVSLSFAISFMMSENFVSGQIGILDTINPAIPTLPSFSPSSIPTPSTFTGGGAGADFVGPPSSLANPEVLLPDPSLPNSGLGVGEIAPKVTETQSFLTGSGPGTISGLFKGQFFGVGPELGGTAFGGAVSSLASGLVWGAIVYGGLRLVGGLFGLSDSQSQALAFAGGAGTFVGTTLYFIGQNFGTTAFLTTGTAAFMWGLGIGVAIFLATYKKEKSEVVQFICEPWQPPIGGRDCEKCNEDPLIPCSEYRCTSLGQACEIKNKGTENEVCVWAHPGDVDAPRITPWNEALKPSELIYTPEGNGYKITLPGAPGGCLEPFSRLEFGLRTNEPSQCRISLDPNATFNGAGTYLFGGSTLFANEHAQRNFRIPNPFVPEEDGDAPTIHNNGLFTLYVRCADANGNGMDGAPTPFRFCVQPGPDTREPVIEGFNIRDGSAVRYEVDFVPIEVYTNEPATCRWSKSDKSYSDMENSMRCATSSRDIGPNSQFTCSGELSGVQDRQNNTFYFRCSDQPLATIGRNTMQYSVPLTLRGTQPLTIQNTAPSGEIRGATSFVNVNLSVTTAHGADEGKATCYYELSENGPFNIAMNGAGTFSHFQPLPREAGNHNVYFRCIDSGGNVASSMTSFNVFVDTQEPMITRIFRDGQSIKIITNEDARCVYSLNSCNYEFESGIPLTYETVGGDIARERHLLEWNKEVTYHIKCEDYQGKRVAPNECSAVIQGAEF